MNSHVHKAQFESKACVGGVGTCVDERAIDLVHLSRQTLGDTELEAELLGLFERQAGQIMRQISSASVGAERSFRRDLAHTLKGSARAVGAHRVAAAADDYEVLLSSAVTEEAIAAARDVLAEAVEEARAAVLDLMQEK